MRFALAAAAVSGLCLTSPAAASAESRAGTHLSHPSHQSADPADRAAAAPASAKPAPGTGPDPAPGAAPQAIGPSQLVEIEEASYTQCLQSAARHYGALAGRAGPGATAPGGDPYADCERAREAWKKALIALNPSGGPAAAEEHIGRKFGSIAAQTSATWQQAFNANNYQ